jgi:hypothetical protein
MNYYIVYQGQIVGRGFNSKQAGELERSLGLPPGSYQVISEFTARRSLSWAQLNAVNNTTNQPF